MVLLQDTVFFESQLMVNKAVDDIVTKLLVPRESLHILGGSHGLIAGNLSFTDCDGNHVCDVHDCKQFTSFRIAHQCFYFGLCYSLKNTINRMFRINNVTLDAYSSSLLLVIIMCSCYKYRNFAIQVVLSASRFSHIPRLPSHITGIQSSARFILVVEKECSFEQILLSGIVEKLDAIIITVCDTNILLPYRIIIDKYSNTQGKGYPDEDTREFTAILSRQMNLPVFG